ncbi:MAG: sulfatase [Bacteroidota bacterium]
MNNKYIPIYLALFGISLPSCIDKNEEESPERPNIIFIMSDDHAVQAISAYGSSINNTAHIDKLAEEGIKFENAFVTNSICAPSRAVILTGKHSHLNGVIDNSSRFDSSQMTFPKILRENGYNTAIVGKWHLKSQPTGFDYWNVLPGQGDYYNPKFIKNGKDTIYEGYVTDITTDLAIDWMESRKGEKSFMLMMQHKAPHRNWMPHTDYLDKYEDIKFPEPANFWEDYTDKEHLQEQKLTIARHMDIRYDLKIPCDTCKQVRVNWWAEKALEDALGRMNEEQLTAWEKGYDDEIRDFFSKESFTEEELAEWKLNRYIQDYLRTIISVDESIGRILSYLEEKDLKDNTLVIYTSDQGFFLGEHGLFDKRYMYEESLQTPLLMMYPEKINSGITSSKLVQNLDIAPTLLDAAGIEIPGSMQGKSLLPLIKGEEDIEWRDAIYYQFYETGWGVSPHYGIRTDSYKLIRFEGNTVSWELYDLKQDPDEMHNVYGKAEYEHVQEELHMKLAELREKYSLTGEE